MENLILFLATTLVIRFSSNKRTKLQFIGDTGCSALLSSDNKVDTNLTQSGDRLYVQEFIDDGVSYGLICVQMNDQYELYEAEEMLRCYIANLKGPLYILHNTGIHDDADWNSEATKTVVDYWQDCSKRDWKVKVYTDGKTLAVLYVKNIGHVDVKKQDLFLDSFHFEAVVN